jgi:hypothetical protein
MRLAPTKEQRPWQVESVRQKGRGVKGETAAVGSASSILSAHGAIGGAGHEIEGLLPTPMRKPSAASTLEWY